MLSEVPDDLLVCIALARFSYDFEDANPELADRAWKLAVKYADQQDMNPSDVVNQVDL